MKSIFAGLLLTAVMGAAQAGTLQSTNTSAVSFNWYNGQPASVTGAKSTGFFGSLFTTSAGTFYATYLGNESAYTNGFKFGMGSSLLESSALGQTISMSVGTGTVGFSFYDSKGATFTNGSASSSTLGFAIMNGSSLSYGPFDYILGFNDSFRGDADYDDFVVGVRFVSAVPEPETYAMLLAGLGLMGFTARRRKASPFA